MRLLFRAAGRLAQLALLVLLVVAAVTAVRIAAAAQHDDRPVSDVIVVLGAAQFNGRPGPYLTPRLQHAADLYAAGVAPVVLTTGGSQPGDDFTEAEAGRAWLVEHGVPSASVVAIGQGSDTLRSVRAAAAVMDERGWHTAVAVTDPWHTLRVTAMLDDEGVDAVGSPTRTGPSNDGLWAAGRYTARETVGYLYYQWQRFTS